MKIHHLLISCVLITTVHAQSAKLQHGLLTDSYEIVSQDDLAYDTNQREGTEMDPYNPEIFLGGNRYWQCIPAKDIEYTYDRYKFEDEVLGKSTVETMCSYEFKIKLKNDPQSFVARRGLPVSQCQDLEKEWRKLTKGQSVVCINGEGGDYHTDKKTGKREKLWTWIKYKTKRGCDSYFAFECDTKGCAKGKCPVHKPVFD